MAVGVFDPGFPTQVGGRHMSGPTSPDRDSSREIDKAPGIMLLTHPAAPLGQCSAGPPLAPPQSDSQQTDSPRRLSERNAGSAAVIEHLGHLLDALGGGIERGCDRGLGGLGPLR